MKKKLGFAPTVGRALPDKYRRKDLDDLSSVVAESDLDLHILRLLELHPKLKVRFRNHDIASLDDPTKKCLLDDINTVLGIRPLRKRKS